LDPNWAFARMWLAILLTHFGRFEEAIPELRRAVELSPTSAIMQAALAYGYARSGRRQEAFEIVKELEARSAGNHVPPYWLAVAYTGLGEGDRALGWLETGYRERDGWLLNVKVDPALDPLRGDRRFVELLRKLRFPD
ncbi:MAG: tetratricopeptide repeat protein, partial [Gemmatimonadetes bacterium]|nr:tetratricopeptide repeat protein [Gemmatimonadota bacterium]